MHLSRGLVAADARLAEADQRVGSDLLALTELDDRDALLAVDVVRPADDARRRDGRVLQQRLLDVPWKDVEAAPNDQVLLAVDDVDVPVVVEAAQVAGVEPAVPDRLRRQLRRAPVAEHDRARTDADLADLAVAVDAHLHAGGRLADGAEASTSRWRRRDERRGFRQAVALADCDRRQAPQDLLGGLRRERRAARDDVTKLRELVLLERQGQQQLEHRRDDSSDLRPVL